MRRRRNPLKFEISNLRSCCVSATLCLCGFIFAPNCAQAVDYQPLAANAKSLLERLDAFGFPLEEPHRKRIVAALEAVDAAALERELDALTAIVVTAETPSKLTAALGQASVVLQERGYTPVVVKVAVSSSAPRPIYFRLPMYVNSPQAGPVYGGEAESTLIRQGQVTLKSDLRDRSDLNRTLMLEWDARLRAGRTLIGLGPEYQLLLMYAHQAGQFEANLEFGFTHSNEPNLRPEKVCEVVVPCSARAAVAVKLRVRDVDGSPTVGRFTFRDRSQHVYPPQAKRLAPDFFFQSQIYRRDGDVVLLPPGELTVDYSRGPEYRTITREIAIPDAPTHELSFDLERWINPQSRGFYCGDHHIHGAGCAHYTSPTEGVTPADMFLQVKGEGLNVGSVLTWGPCYEHQRQYFSATADPLSEPFTVLKYDVEVSGFGSQRLGHTCLLNLRDQTYPGSDGTKTKGWPTWTTPVLRWVKQQGGVTGYPHSASGLAIDAPAAASRQLLALDVDGDAKLSAVEGAKGLLTESFSKIDKDRDASITLPELTASHARAADRLPNYAIPEMNGGGAMEICVSAAHGVCDFISAMDTERIQEWNMWYHLLNCGLPVSCAGETDFPCMSSTRVGQGRTYVQLGKIDRIDYTAWCRGLAEGRSYVSDGYAHALDFTVDDRRYGEDVRLAAPGKVAVTAEVAFGSGTPNGVPYGAVPVQGLRSVGDTRTLYPGTTMPVGGNRKVELIVNGEAVASVDVLADDQVQSLTFNVPIEQSSWVAIRHFPQLHTNVIRVVVADRPIRASRRSAEWCLGVIEQLWRSKSDAIAKSEVDAARQAFDEAKEFYRRVAREAAAEQLR